MLTLAAGASSLVVVPEHGAGLTGWMHGRTSLLRRALPQASVDGNCHAMGCFPLLPYGNRIGHGQFHWFGKEYHLRPNFGDHSHTIHGVGWMVAWNIAEVTPCSVSLTLDHRPDNSWPFAFHGRVDYRLSACALTVAIKLTNLHDQPAPAGIGLHPYFPRAPDPFLQFDAQGVWENGDDALPSRCGPLPPDWRHTAPRRVVESRLDNCFTGWDRSAEILAGPASLRIEASEAFRQVQVFTPSWADFFCVEPVSHVPDAINRPDLPLDQAMHVLAPGETLSGVVRLTVQSADASLQFQT